MLGMTIPLLTINNNKRTVINRRTSNIISNIRGSTRVFSRQSTILTLQHLIRRLISMGINHTNIRLPFNSRSRNFTTTILQRTRSNPHITLNRTIIRGRLPLIPYRLRGTRLINRDQLYRPRPFNYFNLHTIPRGRRIPRTLHLLG